MLRTASLKIIRALGIEGGCNVQLALDAHSDRYYVIEVNPRVSRSSALASKATGYPIAKVATKIAMGLTLDEIPNAVTGKTYAGFEPALDYCVLKIPRWPFDKFNLADRTLGTQMKATGEVMAIERSFEAALLKAVRSLEQDYSSFRIPAFAELTNEEIMTKMMPADDERIFLIAEALRKGITEEEICNLTKIDRWFIRKLKNIIDMEKDLAQGLTEEKLFAAKSISMCDKHISDVTGISEEEILKLRSEKGLRPVYKMVDTCAAEFEAETPYYYSTYDEEDEAIPTSRKKIVVLGSGPIRIGQGIEFDYCSVHSVWALKELGYEAIIINNNPETVSTDFDTSDRLYFEPLVEEDVMHILDNEKPEGIIVQFGGQTAINLAEPLNKRGIAIMGTSVEKIDAAEDRDKFDLLLTALDIPKPPGKTALSVEEAVTIANSIGYPVLVRPSYVLGGRAMEIVYNEMDLLHYMATAARVNPKHPVLVDKYFEGIEAEVDAISDGETVIIPGIMEHIERAGVHSGDSIAVYPAHSLNSVVQEKMTDYTIRLAKALQVKGLINIQYVIYNDEVYVLEVNPRSSRTVPYLSKVTGIPIVNLATKAAMGLKLADLGYHTGLYPTPPYVAVKVPVFSFGKLVQVDTSLGPEMKSTGEVMGVDTDFARALYKGLIAAGLDIPAKGAILATVADKDKEESIPLLKGFSELGFNILATAGTAKALAEKGLNVTEAKKLHEAAPNIIDLIKAGNIQFVINTLTKGKEPERDGFRIRRSAVEHGIPCITSLDTAGVLLHVMQERVKGKDFDLIPLQEYLN